MSEVDYTLINTLMCLAELKTLKSYSRNRYARSLSLEIDGDLYVVDLDGEYKLVNSRNLSHSHQEEEVFSGMGPTAEPQTSNSLTLPSSIKVTHR